MNKYFYTTITISAIALSSSSLNAKESYSQNISETVLETKEELAQNRRVEFHIVESEADAAPAEAGQE